MITARVALVAALLVGLNAEHKGVRRKLARTGSEHRPATRNVVEHDNAIGQDKRMMIR